MGEGGIKATVGSLITRDRQQHLTCEYSSLFSGRHTSCLDEATFREGEATAELQLRLDSAGAPQAPRATAGVVRKRRHGNPRLLTSHAVYTLPYRLAIRPGGFFMVLPVRTNSTNERGAESNLSQFMAEPNLSTIRRDSICASQAFGLFRRTS